MSLLGQRRIWVGFDRCSDLRDPERPWLTYCPCCDDQGTWTTWADAMTCALNHLRVFHCLFCIDQQAPAGRDEVLGELYESCPECTEACTTCDGIAVYPANYNTCAEMLRDLAILRLTAVFCDSCSGVLAVIPLDPEVYA